MHAAPRLSARTIDGLTAWLARGGPHCPILARLVADNMRAVGVYSPAAHRGYFTHLGAHFAGALHALRCAGPVTAGAAGSAEFHRLATQRIELDESVAQLRAAADLGRGAIVLGPHIANYLLYLTRLNQYVPLTIYLRYTKDARRQEAKQRWYRASGVQWISEPANASGALGRLGRMAAALREGRVLFITPDLPRKRDDGTPVRFCDREIYLPAGPAILAVRTGAPLFMLLARPHRARQRILLHGPYAPRHASSERRDAVRQRLQWFATGFEQFLREHTACWYLWGDKRWTRVFRNDPRYVRPLGSSPEVPAAHPLAPVPGVA